MVDSLHNAFFNFSSADMDIDFDSSDSDSDDDFMESPTSLREIGEIALKDFCKKMSMV